jgi:hypothetical protein
MQDSGEREEKRGTKIWEIYIKIIVIDIISLLLLLLLPFWQLLSFSLTHSLVRLNLVSSHSLTHSLHSLWLVGWHEKAENCISLGDASTTATKKKEYIKTISTDHHDQEMMMKSIQRRRWGEKKL